MYLCLHCHIHSFDVALNPLNAELNPTCHLLALLGTHHILYVSRIELNPIYHLLALLGAHHILDVSRIELNPIYHLLALLGAHHILHVSRMRVNFTLRIRKELCVVVTLLC